MGLKIEQLVYLGLHGIVPIERLCNSSVCFMRIVNVVSDVSLSVLLSIHSFHNHKPNSDQNLISSQNIITKSSMPVRRIKAMMTER